MTNSVQMIPKDEWVPRFAKALRGQLPEVSGDEAMALALAEATYIESDLTPEEAVEIYLLEEPPGEGGATEGPVPPVP